MEKSIELLRQGEVVILPTETVYGIAADCSNDTAVAKIYALKDRPKFNPLIIHIYSIEQAEEIAHLTAKGRELAKKYWPGPLTIVAKKKDKNFASLATAGLDTIALRVPAHPITRGILKSGLMLAMPSANISGSLSPTKPEHVKKFFPNAKIIIPGMAAKNQTPQQVRGDGLLIVDGGACEVGLESTIITFDENDNVVVLREGVLQIEGARYNDKEIIAPGMLLKHYAPNNPIRINIQKAAADEVFIGFGAVAGDMNLSSEGNLVEAAANLFAMLHEADSKNKKIAVASVPNVGIGAAINDKLERAASQNEKKHKI